MGSHGSHSISINAPRAPTEERGPTGFSATELLLAGAGACSAWDVVEMLRKRRAPITELTVEIEGHQAADPPWQYERLVLHYRLSGMDLQWAVLERVVRLACVRYCSVLATLRGVAKVEATLELVKPDGGSSGRLPVRLDVGVAEPLEEGEPAADED